MSMEAGSDEGRRFPGRWNLNRRWRRWRRRSIGDRDHHIRWDYAARRQKFSSKPPFYFVLKYVAPPTLTLLTLRYQDKKSGLFEENPVPTWCFLVAVFVCCLIARLMEQRQTFGTKWSRILWRAAIASEVFLVVSLVSIFLQYPMSLMSLIICAALLSVALAWPILCHAYNLIHRETMSVLDNIRAKFACSGECNLTNEEDSPVYRELAIYMDSSVHAQCFRTTNLRVFMSISTSMGTGSAECRRLKAHNGRWNLNGIRRRRIVARDHQIPRSGDYIFASRGQKFSSKHPFYSVLKYMAPSVLTLVALRYQGKTKGLFEENPIPAWCFLVATCVYYLIAGLTEQMQTFETIWSQILRRAAIASGVFLVVSLVSIFLPYPLSFVSLIICIAIQCVVLAWPLLCHAYNLIYGGVTRVLDNIRAKFVCSRECNFRNNVGSPV